MESCKTCKQSCEFAGRPVYNPDCKKYSPISSLVITADNIHTFPKRIVIKSESSGNEFSYTRND